MLQQLIKSGPKEGALKAYLAYLLFYPILFALYLTIPRYIGSWVIDERINLFAPGYRTITLHYAQILVALYLMIRFTHRKLAIIVLAVILHLHLIIRTMEVVLLKLFGHGFNGAFFAHLTWDSAVLTFKFYWWLILLLFLLFGAITLPLLRRAPISWPQGNRRIILILVVLILGVRALWFVDKEFFHQKKQLAVASLLKNGMEYFGTVNLYKQLTWTKEELDFAREVGMIPEVSDFKPIGEHPNVILVYLESVGAKFSSLDSDEYPGLLPNLDRFAAENTYVENFYNSTIGTVNAMVSNSCGMSVFFTNETLKNNSLATMRPCYPNYFHGAGYYQSFIVGSNATFGGRASFYLGREFDEAIGKKELFPKYPQWKSESHKWGLYDRDLFQAMLDRIQELQGKGRPYHLVTVTLNTHPSYYASKGCEVYKKGEQILNSLHCTDQRIGEFLDKLKAMGEYDRSLILFIGDHQFHHFYHNPELGELPYNKVFFAYKKSGQTKPERIVTPGYSPDFAPTLLNLAGFAGEKMGLGKSLLNSRKDYPRLIAQDMEFNGLLSQSPTKGINCYSDELIRTQIQPKKEFLTHCERRKLLTLFDRWFVEELPF